MTYTRAMHDEIRDRAETFASMMAKDLADEIESAIDRWVEEHTTLRGAEKVMYRRRLKRAALKATGQKFINRAHSAEIANSD